MNIEISNAIIIVFVMINVFSFVVMLLDKIKSQRSGSKRISEGMMFFLSVMFGSLGVYAGMFVFRHKTRKWYFLVGIPMVFFENCALLWLVYVFLENSLI